MNSPASREFSAECAERLELAWNRDEEPAWFATIGETTIAEGFALEVEWTAGAGGDVKVAVQRSLEESLGAADATVEARVDAQGKTVYRVVGRVVLAYSIWEMVPEWDR